MFKGYEPTQFSWLKRSNINLLLMVLSIFTILGCASSKATLDAPELPAKHWLDEAPGVPVEHKEKLAAAIPNLYDPQKLFGFEDCVYLSIQQSPLLVNSAVELEIKKIELTDAIWKYLPEPTMSVRLSNNVTSYNSGMDGTSSTYGQPHYEISYSAQFPNPLETYFNHQAQQILVNISIATHRKAIGDTIFKIASMYQQLEAQRKILEAQEQLVPLSKKLTAYWQQLEAVDGRQGVSLNLAIQKEREAELHVESARIESSILRAKLKTITGIDNQQTLNVDSKTAEIILKDFNGYKLNWEDRWSVSEDAYLLRAQLKLNDYNIMLAWAEYVPDIKIDVNQSPPSGQYNPPDGMEDTFVHLTFDFPLIDWGRRYRGVQTARMQKALAFQDQSRMRTEYANVWDEHRQNTDLAETSLKIAQTNLEVAKMEAKEAEINFSEGIEQYPTLAEAQEKLIISQVKYISAELDYNLSKLLWMNVSGVLKERFIGKPASEVL